MGITGKLGAWLGKLILGRRQCVRVGDQVSGWSWVRSGVPQGSVLGPLLFLLFIWDLGEDVSPEEGVVLKYVDDTKLIKGIRNEDDVAELQESLNKLYDWQVANNMAYNGKKSRC